MLINRTEASTLQKAHFNELKMPVSISYTIDGTDCPNCYYDAIGKRSTGKYKPGGPIPFPFGVTCPVCKGKGKIAGGDINETLYALIEWNAARFDIPVPADAITIPKSYVQLTFLITDFQKIIQSKRLNYAGYNFILFGEPVDTYTITPNEYIVSIWKRESL